MTNAIKQQGVEAQSLQRANAPSRTGLPNNSYLTLITSFRAFDRLREEWSNLETRCAKSPSVFQSYDWCRKWSDIYAAPDSQNEIFILAGYHQNKLMFVWPLVKRSRKGLVVLTWMTQPIGQYGDILCDLSVDCTQWINAATKFIRNMKAADCMHLRHVRKEANCSAHAEKFWHDGKLHERAPMMDLTQFKTDADYDARYDSQQRRRRRRIQKKLEEIGPLQFENLEGEAAEIAVDLAIAEKVDWLHDKGRFNDVLGTVHHTELMKQFIREPNCQLKVVVSRLTANGKPVSWEMGFCYHGTHYAYLLSHQRGLIDHSPGRLMLDFAERSALASGLTTFDLMAPYDSYKDSFASGAVLVNDYYLPLSLKGAAYGHGYLHILRPIIRHAYQHMPVPILRVIKRLLLR